MMKSVTINERTFQYETYWESYGECYSEPITIFYEGFQTYSKKKYILFGSVITWKEYKEIFRIYADSNNEKLSKNWWKMKIIKKIKLINRKEELERGELC